MLDTPKMRQVKNEIETKNDKEPNCNSSDHDDEDLELKDKLQKMSQPKSQ